MGLPPGSTDCQSLLWGTHLLYVLQFQTWFAYDHDYYLIDDHPYHQLLLHIHFLGVEDLYLCSLLAEVRQDIGEYDHEEQREEVEPGEAISNTERHI